MKTMQKLFAIAILALLSNAAFVSKADAQTQVGTSPLQQAIGVPWQVGGSWSFTSASTPTSAFNVKSISYYRVLFTPTAGFAGTCAVSIDSAAAVDSNGAPVSPATGGILAAGTIGSCAAAGSYITTAAAPPTNFGRITPTITGAGSVTVTVLGYTDNPAASGSTGSVLVTNFPATQPVSQVSVIDISPGSGNITVQDSGTSSNAMANGQVYVTGTATVGSVASLALTTGYDTVRFLVTGTWTGTLSVEGSMDAGTTWTSLALHQQGTAYTAASFTGNFSGMGAVGALTNVRVRASAAWTGTATVKAVQTTNPTAFYLINPARLQDATTPSIQNTIKAASTPAAASDPALVVAISPNNSLGTQPSGFGALIGFQQAVTASAVALATNASHSFCITALSTNVINVYVGPSGVSTSTGLPLLPGQTACWSLSNTNLAFVIASATGASVAVTGV